MWYPLALVALYALIRPFALSTSHGLLPIIAKVAVPAAIVQPWVSNAKFRHLGAIIPLLVLVALLALAHGGRVDDDEGAYRPWAMRFGQLLGVGCALSVLVTVLVFLT